MKVVMTHGDQARDLDLSTMPIKEAALCEQYTGMSWVEWRSALAADRATAVQFAWWLAGSRAGEGGRFSDVDIDLAKLRWSVELSDEEQAEADALDGEEASEDADLPTGPDEGETQAA